RAVANELPAFENPSQKWMRLPDLKRGVGIEPRIRVLQREDQANRKPVVRKPVNPAAAVHVRGNRPAQRVRDVARLDAAGLDVPQFLDADSVALRIDVVQLLRGDEVLVQRPASALRVLAYRR